MEKIKGYYLRNCTANVPANELRKKGEYIVKIMEALYGGELYPAEQVVSKNPEYRKVLEESDELMEKLEKKLSGEQFSEIDKVCDLLSDAHDIQNREFFEYGLALGMLLMQEAMKVLQIHAQRE